MEKENANVTIGYHCGYISPIPYIDFDERFTEEDMKEFIEVISNDIISWESIKEKMQKILIIQAQTIDEFVKKWHNIIIYM